MPITNLSIAIAGTVLAASTPWLQNVTSDSATVMWLAEKAGTSAIQYGPTQDMKARATTTARMIPATTEGDDKPFILNEIEIRGLQPKTQYFYKVLGGGQQTFTTTPIEQDTVKLAFTSNPNAFAPGKAQQAWKAITQLNPEFVVISGDISNKSTNKNYAQFWARAFPLAATVPVYTVQGNHDAREWTSYTEWVHNETADRFNERFYAFDRGSGHFVMIDDNVPRRADFPVDWFTSTLRKRERRFNIVVMNGNFRRYASMQKIIDENRAYIDVVLTSGNGAMREDNGIVWIEAGGKNYLYAMIEIGQDIIKPKMFEP